MRSLEHGFIRSICRYSYSYQVIFRKVYDGGGEGARKTIINCAIPYFIFNTIFALCTEKTLAINILTPKYIFWYLFSLLIWRLLIDDLKRIKGIFILSILLGLYVGGIHEADRFWRFLEQLYFSHTSC